MIVDNVLAIRKGLTHPEPASAPMNGSTGGGSESEDRDGVFTVNGVPVSPYTYGAVV